MNFFPIYLVFLSISGLTFLSFLFSPIIALRKGYAPYYWLFACGPIGLIVVTCLQSTRMATTPEELDRLQSRANRIGGVLTGIAFFLALPAAGLFVLGIIG